MFEREEIFLEQLQPMFSPASSCHSIHYKCAFSAEGMGKAAQVLLKLMACVVYFYLASFVFQSRVESNSFLN